jgi:hypothetical protein
LLTNEFKENLKTGIAQSFDSTSIINGLNESQARNGELIHRSITSKEDSIKDREDQQWRRDKGICSSRSTTGWTETPVILDEITVLPPPVSHHLHTTGAILPEEMQSTPVTVLGMKRRNVITSSPPSALFDAMELDDLIRRRKQRRKVPILCI